MMFLHWAMPTQLILLSLALLAKASSSASLSNDQLLQIPSPGDDFNIDTGQLLAPILSPRVPGTEGSHEVQRHFVDFFTDNLPSWTIISQNSTSKTPATGNREVPFTNWIFRRDPPWVKAEGDVGRLTLAAHFDSLIEQEGFIGAVDSAVPCAILLHVARSIDASLSARWAAMEKNGDVLEAKGIQIIFMDGEEAFGEWTDEDSLYGARSLAEDWDSKSYEATATYETTLQSIDLFVLLDLLGAPSPSVPSYFLPTHWAYQKMATLEKRMRDLSILESSPHSPFLPDYNKLASAFDGFFIADDHVPFMQRGVDVLHLIPNHYPKVWHTMEDDGEHLDLETSRDWGRIVTAFVMEWLDLGAYVSK